ncbi:MAG: hypothetical protein JNM43_10450 [Planctomycetaceae bacterium]|nr:hypothetical protein [Planctomycetaceae bacterium]
MKLRFSIPAFVIVASMLLGCDSGPAPAAGGTSGTLKFGDAVTSDIVITVHRANGASLEVVGFGTTQPDGSFVLYKPGAGEPLFLEPGSYSCTLESVGPPLKLPKEYLEASRSPLKIEWTADLKSLDLTAPAKILSP